MNRLSLSLLGPPDIRHNGHLLTFRSRKALALLIYLAVNGGRYSRNHLIALLWPDSDTTRGRTNLRSALALLRHELAESMGGATSHILIAGDTLGFDVTSTVDIDLQLVFKAMQAVQASRLDLQRPIAQLEAAIAGYRGDFLLGFSLGDAPAFDDWISAQRAHWHQQMSLIYGALVEWRAEGGELTQAIDTATRWIAHDPLNEIAYQRLMQLYFTAGDRVAALRTYNACCATLAAELQTEPSQHTTALAERIRSAVSNLVRRRFSAGSGGSTHPRPALIGLPMIPLVGRTKEYSTLTKHYYVAHSGQIQVVLLEGEAGIGKTCLASDFLQWVFAQGADVIQGQAFETGDQLSYQPLVDALRERFERERAPDDLLADVWLMELSRLLPELRDRYPDLPLPATPGEADTRISLFEAIARALQALANQRSLVLFIDDIQWADAVSLDVLHYVIRRLKEQNVSLLMLLSVRSESLITTPGLARWLTGLERDLPVTRLPLGLLTTDDTMRLIAALGIDDTIDATSSRADLEPFGRWLFTETGGQPFFMLETLKTLLDQGVLSVRYQANGVWRLDLTAYDRAALGRILPPPVRNAIRTRLGQLGPSAMALLTAAAVLDHRLTFVRLCQVADLTEHDGLSALDELLRHRLLLERAGESSEMPHDEYVFTHDKIREVLYAEVCGARRRMLHRRAFHVLRAAGAPMTDLVYHALATGLVEEAERNIDQVEVAETQWDAAETSSAKWNSEMILTQEERILMLTSD